MATKFNASKYAEVSPVSDFYSDFHMNMDIHPGTGDVVRVRNEQAIVQSIRNLLMTDFYERPFAPSVGSDIKRALFENISPAMSVVIKTAIEDTLSNYEPRAQILETVVAPDDDNNGYNIRLKFSLINSTTPTEINFFLDRIR